MHLSAGTRLSHYEIKGPLGEGGMGVVYRASDTKLGRDVAIKVLSGQFTGDAERLARFDREARVLASLSHPYIAAIHGLEELDGTKFLVMELAPGQTLADSLLRGALPPREAIDIARQIAEALEAAHEKGIVHRDLKPANVMIDDDGRVKVLDFGLARAMETEQTNQDLSNSPTMMRYGTNAGVILGTAGYMSPEQARGKRVDERADIWSFGVVLWEMLTGKRLFEGETVSDTLAAVLTRDVDLEGLPSDTPASVVWGLRRCLERDPKKRFRDIGDVRLAMDAAPLVPAQMPVAPRSTRSRRWLYGLIALLLAGLAVLAAALYIRPGPVEGRVLHTAITLPAGTRLALTGFQPGPPMLSPDGKRIAIVLDEPGGARRIWMREMSSSRARPLEGTDGASYPFWSHDGQHLGFFANEKLKRVPAVGGNVLVIADAANPKGGAWSRDDVILFTPAFNSPLFKVSASGGTPVAFTRVDTAAGDSSHRYPQFLPDGKRFSYLIRKRNEEGNRTVLGFMDGKEKKDIVQSDTNAVFAGEYLLFLRDRTLLAQRFDQAEEMLSGSPVPLTENVRTVPHTGYAIIQASDDALLFQTGDALEQKQLIWLDRSGGSPSPLGDPAKYLRGELSPDRKRIAMRIDTSLWLIDALSGTRERLTFDDTIGIGSAWSPSGAELAFGSDAGGAYQILVQSLAGDEPARVVVPNRDRNFMMRPSSWSPDGRHLLYERENLTGNTTTLLVVDFETNTASTIGEVSVRFSRPQFSPDGRWIAYSDLNGSGRTTIFVASFPDTGRRWEVGSGSEPLWSTDGKELFFTGSESILYSVEVAPKGRASFAWTAAKALFPVESAPIGIDGERFLVEREASVGLDAPLELIMNWRRLLEEKSP